MTKIKLNQTSIIDFIHIILLIFVLFCTDEGIWGYGSEKLVIYTVFSIILLLMGYAHIKKNNSFKLFRFLFIVVIVYTFISYFSSFSPAASRPYFLRLLFFGIIINLDFDVDYFKKFVKYVKICGVIISLSYIISFPFLGKQAGIYHNFQYTAIILSVCIGFYIPDLFESKNQNQRIKGIIAVMLCIIAIILTGKRSLFLIPVILFFIIAFFFDDKKKHSKVIVIFSVSLMLIFVLQIIAPNALNSVNRLLDSSDTTFSSRTYFWQYALMLWENNPIFGIGIGAFPTHIATGGVKMSQYHYIPAFDAHNIYYQMLAEIGIVGIVLYVTLFIIGVVYTLNTIKLTKNKNNRGLLTLSLISLYCEGWFLIYGISGNPLYMVGEFFTFFIAVMMSMSIRNGLNREKEINEVRK